MLILRSKPQAPPSGLCDLDCYTSKVGFPFVWLLVITPRSLEAFYSATPFLFFLLSFHILIMRVVKSFGSFIFNHR